MEQEEEENKFKSLHRRLSDLLRSTIKNADRDRRHTYSPPPPVPYIKKVAADTKARSLITCSQLANYCVIPTVVSDQSGISDLLKNYVIYEEGDQEKLPPNYIQKYMYIVTK